MILNAIYDGKIKVLENKNIMIFKYDGNNTANAKRNKCVVIIEG